MYICIDIYNNPVVNLSEYLLITSTLLVLKTENIYRNTRKCH